MHFEAFSAQMENDYERIDAFCFVRFTSEFHAVGHNFDFRHSHKINKRRGAWYDCLLSKRFIEAEQIWSKVMVGAMYVFSVH